MFTIPKWVIYGIVSPTLQSHSQPRMSFHHFQHDSHSFAQSLAQRHNVRR
jgi:hypothetical protein